MANPVIHCQTATPSISFHPRKFILLNRILFLLLVVTLSACGTTHVSLKYSAPPAIVQASARAQPLLVGTFTDKRGEPATWLGAIRGGYGNPLKNLESDKPVAELVKAAFLE